MTTDICLSFPDQAAQQNVLPLATQAAPAPYANIDVIGFIASRASSGVNAQGFPIYPPDTSHWLVNVRLLDGETVSDAVQAYVIADPVYPKRVWA